MTRYDVGLIRVVSVQDKDLLNLHAGIIEKAFPELRILSGCIPHQPKGIYDTETERQAVPKIVELAIRMGEKEHDALIISCAADPAIEETRRALSIPVIGAGSAAASLALCYDKKIGILDLGEETPRVIEETLTDRIVARDYPHGVENTLDLTTDRGRTATVEAAQRLKQRGAGTIVLACTGMSTIRIAPLLEERTGLIVIDPVIASGAAALHALKRRMVWSML